MNSEGIRIPAQAGEGGGGPLRLACAAGAALPAAPGANSKTRDESLGWLYDAT